MSRRLNLLAAMLVLLGTPSCASRVEHREFSDAQVGLAALQEDNVRRVVLGAEIQSYVSTFPVFAETVNRQVLNDLGGYVEQYNVYAREPLTYPQTGVDELDSFLLRASRASATVRVGTRLMNFIGARLYYLDEPEKVSRDQAEVYFSVTPEQMSAAIQRVRERKGTLSRDQKQAIARDVIALVADIEAVGEATQQAKGLVAEGENLKQLLGSSSYQAELKSKDPGKAAILPEIISNLNGAIAGLRTAETNGASLSRNAKIWKLYLVDAIQ